MTDEKRNELLSLAHTIDSDIAMAIGELKSAKPSEFMLTLIMLKLTMTTHKIAKLL